MKKVVSMKEIRICQIGGGQIGKSHSNAYRNVSAFFDINVQPIMKVFCDINKETAKNLAQMQGWQEWSADWREAINRKDIDIVDICTPNFLHKEMVIAAAEAKKDIICEKPLARSLPEAILMFNAVCKNNVKHMSTFMNRCIPAIKLAKEFIDNGDLGEIYHWRARWIDDLDPEFLFCWYFKKDQAGSGAIGDIGSHIIDLAHFLIGPISEVISQSRTFIGERFLDSSFKQKAKVDVDDAGQFLARFTNGAIGTFEVSRCYAGYRREIDVEINGSKGTLQFNSKSYNILKYYSCDEEKKKQGFHIIYVGNNEHPYKEAIIPYGEALGRNDLTVIQAYELLNALGKGLNPSPSFLDGVNCQAVVDAVLESIIDKQWKKPQYLKN
jgi:predicted dehydrogenase